MKICIIDSGIDESLVLQKNMNIRSYTELWYGYEQNSPCIDITEYSLKDIARWRMYPNQKSFFRDLNGHGSKVIDIIHSFNNDNEYHVFNILDENKSGNEDCLNEALEYSLSICPDIIHLSLGSFSEENKDKLHFLTSKAVSNGIMVVCAASAEESYPSAFTHVITVGNQNMIDVHGINESVNCYIPDGYLEGGVQDTSSAAAVFTGVVARYKKENVEKKYDRQVG